MEKTLSKKFKHIGEAAKSTRKYIYGRKKGHIKSLATGIKKLDNTLLDGIEWGSIVTLGGLSGSGKSLLLELLKRGIIDHNKEDLEILSFEMEMLSTHQVARNLSGRLNLSVRQILSNKYKMSSEEENKMNTAIDDMSKYPIYYVDKHLTVEQIKQYILDFVVETEAIEKDKGIVITLDHILLVLESQNEGDKIKISNFYRMLIQLKMYFHGLGVKVIFIMAAQLNREIEKTERIINQDLQYPNKNDIFGSSAVYQGSDIVFIMHKPVNIDGMTETYGPRKSNGKGLPVMLNVDGELRPAVYLHCIKNRMDDNKILAFYDDFANSRIGEYSPQG